MTERSCETCKNGIFGVNYPGWERRSCTLRISCVNGSEWEPLKYPAPEAKHDTGKPGPVESQTLIASVCDELKAFLLEKNQSYGDSFRSADLPLPLPSGAQVTPRDLLVLRINDKLKRLRDGHEHAGDDTWKDLAGYCVLNLVLMKVEDMEQ